MMRCITAVRNRTFVQTDDYQRVQCNGQDRTGLGGRSHAAPESQHSECFTDTLTHDELEAFSWYKQ